MINIPCAGVADFLLYFYVKKKIWSNKKYENINKY